MNPSVNMTPPLLVMPIVLFTMAVIVAQTAGQVPPQRCMRKQVHTLAKGDTAHLLCFNSAANVQWYVSHCGQLQLVGSPKVHTTLSPDKRKRDTALHSAGVEIYDRAEFYCFVGPNCSAQHTMNVIGEPSEPEFQMNFTASNFVTMTILPQHHTQPLLSRYSVEMCSILPEENDPEPLCIAKKFPASQTMVELQLDRFSPFLLAESATGHKYMFVSVVAENVRGKWGNGSQKNITQDVLLFSQHARETGPMPTNTMNASVCTCTNARETGDGAISHGSTSHDSTSHGLVKNITAEQGGVISTCSSSLSHHHIHWTTMVWTAAASVLAKVFSSWQLSY